MKSKKGLLFLIAVLVVLIGGAYVLYSKLSAGHQGNLMVQEGAAGSDTLEDSQENEEEIKEDQKADSDQSQEFDAADTEAGPVDTEQESDDEAEKMMAPVFQVTDGEGNPVVLSDFYGKPIVVNFWASWCGPCKSEMPDFQTAYEAYGEEVNFLMVNMTDGARETVEEAQKFITEQEYTFPIYFDTESNAAITYGVRSIPSTFFIDAEGYAVAYAQGAIDGEMLQTGLDMIMTAEQ